MSWSDPSSVEPQSSDLSWNQVTLQGLSGYNESVADTTPAEIVMQHFKDRPQLPAVLIMRGSHFLGLLSRTAFFQLMSRRMGLEVYGKRPVTLLLEHGKVDSILLPSDYPLLEAIAQCLARPEENLYEPIAVQDGTDFRIVNFTELILAQSRLLAETMEQIEEQRVLLQDRNREILDSIYYAERIQKAMLRNHHQFHPAPLDLFFLYRPRDIVSGDFYWTAERDQKVFVAAVDCTGHGVPGAFMSMIGHNLLNEIVLSGGVSEPNEILNLLHDKVRRSLNQSNDNLEDRDGMDLCLCVLDLEQGHLDFSGAKRSLFFTLPNGELFVAKADRHSIGGYQRDSSRVFGLSRIPLEPGQTFYLATDGYVDQPSETNEKFGSERFRQLLKEIAAYPLAQKHQTLVAALEQHQGLEPQRDDITVVGLEWRGLGPKTD